MSDPYFFGYGSLVNTATHSYPNTQTATLRGWRRAWVCTEDRDVTFLTAIKADEATQIQGLIAAVPNGDWSALDLRETGYQRVPSKGNVSHDTPSITDIAHYAVSPDDMRAAGHHKILLSYLDVVIQGYHHVFGSTGVQAFFDTTDNWHIPILNDRNAPQYPRHQSLSHAETDLVDQHLTRLGAHII